MTRTQEKNLSSQRIADLIGGTNKTVKEIAFEVGCSENMIWRLRKKSAIPNLEVMRGLVRCFGVSADYLLGLTDEADSGELVGKYAEMASVYEMFLKRLQKKNGGQK